MHDNEIIELKALIKAIHVNTLKAEMFIVTLFLGFY